MSWGAATSSANAAAYPGLPSIHLPSVAKIRSWLASPGWGPLPQQAVGTAQGHSHTAPTAATRPTGGSGRPIGKSPSQLAPYAPLARLTKQGPSGSLQHGFNAGTSKRVAAKSTATSNYFQNADGSYTRQLSQGPVNYQDSTGAWQPINTALTPAAGGGWAEKANSLSVGFAGSADDPALASIDVGGGLGISWALAGAATSKGSMSGSTATYPAVSPATDLKLTSTPSGVEESLVLHSAAAADSWSFPLTPAGLSARQAADGSIDLVGNAGKTVGVISPAFAYDSKPGQPAGTHAVTYRLESTATGDELTMSLDPSWLHDPARVFPVTVDPTTNMDNFPVSSTTYVESPAAETADNSMDPTMFVGSSDSGTHDANSFIDFPDNGLDGSTATVTGASLDLFDVYSASCTAERFDVAAVTQAWTPSQTTAYPGPTYGASIGNLTSAVPNSCANTSQNTSVGDYLTVPLSVATFNSWSAHSSSDYGLALYAATTDAVHWKEFASANGIDGPVLSLTYTGFLLPAIRSQYPANGSAQTTLMPVLSADGQEDPDLVAPVKFDFQVANSSGAVLADSGLTTLSYYTVPSGKLSWGEDYYWTVQAYDGTNYSLNPVWNSLTTTVPQPVITSTLSQNADGHGYNGAIGNYTTSATDVSIKTIGPSLDVVRDYNSQDPRVTGAFGASWSSVFDARATEQDDSSGAVQSVVVTYPDGSEVGYGKNSNGTFSPPQGRFATFASVSGGGYSLIDKNDTKYLFTQSLTGGVYGITSIADAFGRALDFTWTSEQITLVESMASQEDLSLIWTTPAGATVPHIQEVETFEAVDGVPSSTQDWTYTYSGDELASACPPGTTTACTAYAYQGGSSYQTQVLDEGASSMWPLTEASGTNAADAVIANEGAQNGTYSNVTLGQPSGPLTGGGPVAQFKGPGVNSVVSLPSLHLGTVPNFSFSLWFKTTTDNGVLLSTSDNPLAATSTAAGNIAPVLYVGSDGKLNGLYWWNGALPTPIVSASAVTDGNWHHVVFSSASNLQTMWLDNVQVGTKPGWATAGDSPSFTNPLTNTYLGAGYLDSDWPDQPNTTQGTEYGTYFTGYIADAAYFARPLNSTDVAGMYAASKHSSSLLKQIGRPSAKTFALVQYNGPNNAVSQVTDQNGGVWKLAAPTVAGSSQVYRSAVLGAGPSDYYRLGDNAGAATAADEVHGGATTYNNVTLGVSGPFADENAASFNGTSSYAVLPTGVLDSAPQSVGIWFNTTKPSEVLVGAAAGPLTLPSWPAYNAEMYIGTDGKLAAEAWTGDAYTPMYSKAAVNDGKWHFAVLSAQSGTQTLYIDGAMAATKTGTVNMAGNTYVTIGAGWLGGTWPDESAGGGSSAVQYFSGSIAEAAVYPSALTGDQVTAQYQAARGSQGLSPVESVTVTDPTNATLTDRFDLDNGFRELSQTDGLGHTTSYGYDTSGFLYTVTDPNGNVTTTGHDVRGNTVSQTTCQNQAANICSTSYYTYLPDDTTTQLTPSPRNDLLATIRDGRSASATDNTYLTTYTYDALGDKTAVTTPPVPGYPSDRTTSITYSDGTNTYLASDAGPIPAGLPVKTVSPGGATNLVTYDQYGNPTATTNADGLVTDFTYDNLDRVVTKTVNPGLTAGSWPMTQTTGTTVADASGSGNAATEANVTWTGSSGTFNGTSSYVQPPNNLISSTPFNSVSLWFKTSATTAETLFSTGSYLPGTTAGPNAMPVLYVGSDGKLHGHFWDLTAAGMASTTAVNNNAWHHVVLTSNSIGQTLYLDGAVVGTESNQVYNSDPYEFVGAGVYNSNGWPDAPSGNVWNYFSGSITNVQLYHENLSSTQVSSLYSAGMAGAAFANQSSPINMTTTDTYDSQNNVLTETDPAVTDRVTGAVHTAKTTNVYDVDGDLTSQSVADITGGDSTRTVSSVYNNFDQVQTATDADTHTTSYVYDPYGNIQTETDPNGNTMLWVYDADSHQLSQSLTNYTGSPLNPQPATSQMEWSKAYDPAGQLASVTDSLGNMTNYTYFDNGLSATTTRVSADGTQSYVVESDSYDAAGNQTGKVTNNGATSEKISLDAADRTAKTVLDPTGVDRTTTYGYTPDDQVASTTQTDPSGATATTTATFDSMGNQLSQSLYQDGSGHPAGWWPMNQISGTAITDASGTGNTATEANVTWNGAAGVFNGTTSAAATSGPVLNTAAAYSISAWVNETSASTAQTFVAQIGSHSSAFLLQNDPGTDKWRFALTASDVASPTYIGVESTTAIALNTWTHLVGIYNAATGTISLTVNNGTPVTAAFTSAWSAPGALVIGRNLQTSVAGQYTNGQIANVQVYPRVLSSADIGTLYTNGRGGGTTASTTTTTSRTLDVRGLPTSSTDPDQNVTHYVYDEAGHLAETIDPTVSVESNGSAPVVENPTSITGYDTFGEPAESQDPDGNVTHTYYDANGNKSSQVLPSYTPPGGTAITNATTVWNYDLDGQLTGVTDPLSNSTTYLYDQLGDVVKTTDPLGYYSTATYDTNGEERSTTDPTGAQSQATYDWMGRAKTSTIQDRYPSPTTSTTNYSYTASATDPDGAFLSSTTTPDGANTSYGYNDLGEQTQVTDPAGNTTKTAYDFLGRPIITTMPDLSTTNTAYDDEGDVLKSTVMDALGNVLDKSSSTYDAAGHEMSATDGRGFTSTFMYDATGAPTQEVQPVTATTSITTSFGYDAAGKTTRYTDGRGNKTIYTYNTWGLQESQIEPQTSTYNTAALSTFTTAYDADGRPTTQTAPGATPVTITNGYDLDGNLQTQTGTGAEATTAARTFTYDTDGRVLTANTAAVGTSGSVGYQPSSSIGFTYDDRGLLLTASGTGGSTAFAYNGDGLMTSQADAAGTTGYGYTNASDPDQLTTVTDADTGVAAQYSYNTMEQVSQVQYGTGGDLRKYTYNTQHELTGDSLTNAAGTTTIASIGYTYDNDGDLLTKDTTGFSGSASNTYTYDEADRLSSWQVGSATPTAYSYDGSGNRTQVGANVYTYDARDELTSDGVNSYAYTARGTLSSEMSTSASTAFTTDAYNQQITDGTQTYGYDASGRVMTDSSSSGGTRSFAYDGDSNNLASDGSSTYSWDPSGALVGIGTAVTGGGTVAGSGTLAYVDQHTDVVGDFTPTAAALSGSTTYDPLGNVTATSGQVGSLGYQSGWTDSSTGKVNMGSRWYNPASGQFMNRDTAQVSPTPSSAEANPFAYVGDDPMTATDPTGHCSNWLCSAASAVNRDVIQPAWHWTDTNVIQPAEHAVQAAVNWATQSAETLWHDITTEMNKIDDMITQIQHELAVIEKQISSAAAWANKQVTTVTHTVATVYHQTVSAATKAVASTVSFVKNHAAAIASIAVGAVVFGGCLLATAGAGSIACAALSGAAASGVSYAMSCGKSQAGCSALGAAEAIGIGAVGGALGGALAGPLGGKLVSQALDDILPDIVTSALVGAYSGAGAGAVTGGLTYAAGCSSSQDGCSWSGLGSSTLGGAEQGAIAGGAGGALGGAAGKLRPSGAGGGGDGDGGGAPDEDPDEDSGCSGSPHSFVGSTGVLMADGGTKPIDQIKVGDEIANSVPGQGTIQDHKVTAVIVTTTDHDFVNLDIAPATDQALTGQATTDKSATGGTTTSGSSVLKRATLGLAASVLAVAGTLATVNGPAMPTTSVALSTTAAVSASTTSDLTTNSGTLTTTFHHPFYDVTQASFVEAQHLAVGDELQTPTGYAVITGLHLYHANTTTYDLTIGTLHTFYVVAGNTPILVHNINGPSQMCGGGVSINMQAEEAAGGHTMEFHVGISDADLQARGIPIASTFPDVEAAEYATEMNINRNAEQVQRFLSGNKYKTELNTFVGSPLMGRAYVAATGDFVPTNWVRTFLVKDPNTLLGYHVETSFPLP